MSFGGAKANLVILLFEDTVDLFFILGGCQVHAAFSIGIIKIIYFNSKYYWSKRMIFFRLELKMNQENDKYEKIQDSV